MLHPEAQFLTTYIYTYTPFIYSFHRNLYAFHILTVVKILTGGNQPFDESARDILKDPF